MGAIDPTPDPSTGFITPVECPADPEGASTLVHAKGGGGKTDWHAGVAARAAWAGGLMSAVIESTTGGCFLVTWGDHDLWGGEARLRGGKALGPEGVRGGKSCTDRSGASVQASTTGTCIVAGAGRGEAIVCWVGAG